MAMAPNTAPHASAAPTGNKGTIMAAFLAVTLLFFAWGFITSLIDPLVAAVKGIFVLSDTQAQLSAFAFFIAYGVVSFPAAALIAKWRAVPSILAALTMMVVACLIMLGAANIANYNLVLFGLFVLASGITILQVAANPLAAALGSPEKSHFRLTLSQTFNSFGTIIGPALGASLFLAGVEVADGVALTDEVRANALGGIDRAYFWICGLLIALLAFFYLARRTVAAAAPPIGSGKGMAELIRDAFGSRWAVLGAAAIFLYVGAEVAIGTQMALFLNSDATWGMPLQDAAALVSFYWGGAFVGRIAGTVLLYFFNASRLLAIFTGIACAMCLYVFAVGGVTSGYVALAIGLFNSIMFPVIFTLTLERSSASEEATSGLLCTGIIGGAFVPLLVGAVSDATSYAFAFIVPAVCYLLLAIFALSAGRAANGVARSPRASGQTQ
ncbi:glucose/galactose MFS transporter [Erythrobacter sp. SDW2]|uniref:glucose/galactose MFS transporter n=1 Tax=Erythrobacter sp. SDW2 TaxID=2907154 RepID=UPI001F3CB0AB|nr:glucose/galactose MFS transporter [Erythrobacter sp. SDW2]UIP06160.1 glucose/galactose MFS transporter [Erythrobacter sp. SDW2]